MFRRSIRLSFIALCLLLLPLAGNAEESDFCADGVYFSEVSAKGGEWIELYNGGEDAVDLSGWIMADKRLPEDGFILSGTVAAHGYILFDQLPFKISAAGETLYLYDSLGYQKDVFKTGALEKGLTSGRVPERGNTRLFFPIPTPGTANGEGYIGYAPEPVLSDRTLYRTGPFQVTVSGAGAEFRYTLDGSEPTRESERYTEPLQIKKNTVLRVRGFMDDCLPSETVSVTYLFEKQYDLPTVTVVMDPEEWDKLRTDKSKEVEMAGAVTFYEGDGTFGISFPAGLRVRGNASRKNPHKSFGVHLRAVYGQRTVTYPFWGEGTALPYANLTLRTGSQDMFKARMRDAFAITASAGLRVDKTRTRLTILYVNGAFYGLANLNEGMNQDYVEAHYGVPGEKVNIVDRNDIVAHGTGDGVLKLRKFISSHDLAKDENYETFCTMVDIDAFTDYLIAQSFFCNSDYHNLKYWGTDDGSFLYRPVLYDLDCTLLEGNSHYNNVSKFFSAKGFSYGINNFYVDTGLFGALKRNAGWREKFLDRFAYLLNNDFSVDRLEKLLDDMAAEMEPVIHLDVEKWGNPNSVATWKKQVKILRQQIALRHEKVQGIVCKEFDVNKKDWAALMEKYSA